MKFNRLVETLDIGNGYQAPVGFMLGTAKAAVKVAFATASSDQRLLVSGYQLAPSTAGDLELLLKSNQSLLIQEISARKRKP